MNVESKYLSPNFDEAQIEVEFLVLHYTACDLKKTLEIFLDREKKVTAHFVIDLDGTCYDLGNFLSQRIRRGSHAGPSHIKTKDGLFTSLNDISIGIEIVNLNGNHFKYTENQYQTLAELAKSLQKRFSNLKDSDRIVGHEHIAGWRGKADPGVQFNWARFLEDLKLKPALVHSYHACDESDLAFLETKIRQEKPEVGANFWPELSSELELRIAAKNSGGNEGL